MYSKNSVQIGPFRGNISPFPRTSTPEPGIAGIKNKLRSNASITIDTETTEQPADVVETPSPTPDPNVSKAALDEVMAAVPEISAFAMTDALARRNVAQALARLEELFVSKEPPLKIIGLLAYNVRRWWQVRQVMDRRGSEAEMLAALGARTENPGMAKRTISQSRSFRDSALKQALLTLADANVAIRSGGDPKPYLERVIIELCQ